MFYGDDFKVECPTGSGEFMHLGHVAEEIQHRLQHIFAQNEHGRRACNAGHDMLDFNPHWCNNLWFHEFFHADDGRGLGASHQTGWTGLVAKLIHDSGINCRVPQTPRTPGAAANHYFDDIFSRVSKPKPYMGRRQSTRSIDARSDWGGDEDEDEDEEERMARERDDEEVLSYVTQQLQRVKSNVSVFGVEDDELEASL